MKRSLCVIILAVCFALSCKGQIPEDAAAANTDIAALPTDTAAPTEAPSPVPAETAAPTEAPAEAPAPVTVEWLASELELRRITGRIALEQADFSDVMEMNEDTDLFYYANLLEIEMDKLGSAERIISAGPCKADAAQVLNETETAVTVRVHAEPQIEWADPNISGGGIDFIITVDKQRMVITAYSQPDIHEGIYSYLEPLASRYRQSGLSWQEADKKAYDELSARIAAGDL